MSPPPFGSICLGYPVLAVLSDPFGATVRACLATRRSQLRHFSQVGSVLQRETRSAFQLHAQSSCAQCHGSSVRPVGLTDCLWYVQPILWTCTFMRWHRLSLTSGSLAAGPGARCPLRHAWDSLVAATVWVSSPWVSGPGRSCHGAQRVQARQRCARNWDTSCGHREALREWFLNCMLGPCGGCQSRPRFFILSL